MNQEILNYIKSQRIGVLAVEMLDGSPHGATIHFAHGDDQLKFFFMTDKEYRKSEPLLKNGSTRATVVLGFDENDMKTLQLDGTASLVVEENDKKLCEEIYFSKFPEKEKWKGDPDSIFILFTPNWWRFTDYTKSEGKNIILSTDK